MNIHTKLSAHAAVNLPNLCTYEFNRISRILTGKTRKEIVNDEDFTFKIRQLLMLIPENTEEEVIKGSIQDTDEQRSIHNNACCIGYFIQTWLDNRDDKFEGWNMGKRCSHNVYTLCQKMWSKTSERSTSKNNKLR